MTRRRAEPTRIRKQVATDANLMPALGNAARADVSEGEIVEAFQDVWGSCIESPASDACHVVTFPPLARAAPDVGAVVTNVDAEALPLSLAHASASLRAGAVPSSSTAPARRDLQMSKGQS